MKNVSIFCLIILFLCFTINISAQNKKKQQEDYDDDFYYEIEDFQDITWKQKGFEFYFGAGAYFGGKYTANYYNGAFYNEFNLNLLINNPYRRDTILNIIREKYRYLSMDDRIELMNPQYYNTNSKYNVAMDIAVGARYRVAKNWFVELNYSFRRITAENIFWFDFLDVPPGNIYPNYSNNEIMGAKEDRHYIDFSIGYISHNHPIVKPFFAIGGMFTYIRLKSFDVIIEGRRFDLMNMARYPNSIPGVPNDQNWWEWAGPGYGFSITAGLKFAVNKSISIDPVFQLSVASFGNGNYFKSEIYDGYNTSLGCNYYAGIRLVMSGAGVLKNEKKND